MFTIPIAIGMHNLLMCAELLAVVEKNEGLNKRESFSYGIFFVIFSFKAAMLISESHLLRVCLL